jgi:hypothetical protein
LQFHPLITYVLCPSILKAWLDWILFFRVESALLFFFFLKVWNWMSYIKDTWSWDMCKKLCIVVILVGTYCFYSSTKFLNFEHGTLVPFFWYIAGHPALIGRHRPFPVTHQAAERWLHHMQQALDTTPDIDDDSKIKMMNFFRFIFWFKMKLPAKWLHVNTW